jgi:hypothetical protein
MAGAASKGARASAPLLHEERTAEIAFGFQISTKYNYNIDLPRSI